MRANTEARIAAASGAACAASSGPRSVTVTVEDAAPGRVWDRCKGDSDEGAADDRDEAEAEAAGGGEEADAGACSDAAAVANEGNEGPSEGAPNEGRNAVDGGSERVAPMASEDDAADDDIEEEEAERVEGGDRPAVAKLPLAPALPPETSAAADEAVSGANADAACDDGAAAAAAERWAKDAAAAAAAGIPSAPSWLEIEAAERALSSRMRCRKAETPSSFSPLPPRAETAAAAAVGSC
jgi:colicin import membrane protein